MIEFSAPLAFLLLPLPLLIWWLTPPHKERIRALRVPFFSRLVEAIGETPAAGAVILPRQLFQLLLGILVWALIVTALARPERMGDPVTIQKPARDVILAVDISGSMDERDFTDAQGKKIQRLAGVKQVMANFLDGREGERIALIVFGTEAFVQAPLTTDLDTLLDFLKDTEVGMAGPHTALGDAIGLSIKQFETSEVKQRLLILLSDGSDTASIMSPVNAAEIAAQQGVTIITIGVGDPQGEGENRLDEATLKAIAQTTAGKFYYASDQNALEEIYKRIDQLAPKLVDSETFRPRLSLAAWPLGAALLLGLLGFALRALQISQSRGSLAEGESATEQEARVP